jgi:hypothetical protein
MEIIASFPIPFNFEEILNYMDCNACNWIEENDFPEFNNSIVGSFSASLMNKVGGKKKPLSAY